MIKKKLEGYFVAYRGNRWGTFHSEEEAEIFGKALKVKKREADKTYPFFIHKGIAIVTNRKLCFGSELCCVAKIG